MADKKTVVVGMSGGVDSSVAAYLLKEQGYDVIGVTMQIWQEEDTCGKSAAENGCCGSSAVDDAQRVANVIGIPYYVMNFREEFKKNVMDYFAGEYWLGRTPNPCIACNRYVKWESLLRRSLSIGADYIATGHYARCEITPSGRYSIKKSVTAKKDQTYALYNLTQEQLKRTLMPVGEYEKEKVRKIANEAGLPVANKPDSQEICFIPDNDYAGFLCEYCKRESVPGNFVDTNGKILGRHKGIIHYTVGQRKGLGISFSEPLFVTEIRPDSNEVVLGRADEVFSEVLYADNINFMAVPEFKDGDRFLAKIRYNHAGSPCRVYNYKGGIRCEFEEPQRAVTPGQAVVLYDGDYVAGGGTICAGKYK